uniref:Uncharacterized protein n=1 Tax=Pseudonaja textilis TaxID=8673 RepID=A0A670ZPL4_PSETE
MGGTSARQGMSPLAVFFLAICVGVAFALEDPTMPPDYNKTEEGASLFADAYNTTGETIFSQSMFANWNYNTNLTDREAQHLQIMASLKEQNFTELWGKKAKENYGNIWQNFSDPQLKKIISSIQILGPSNLPVKKREQVRISILEIWVNSEVSMRKKRF